MLWFKILLKRISYSNMFTEYKSINDIILILIKILNP